MTTTPRKTNTDNCRIHWRSLLTEAQGQSATTLHEAEARRAIATLNGAHAGRFHWWFVIEEPSAEPESNTELRQAVSE